jgi:ribosomal protein L18
MRHAPGSDTERLPTARQDLASLLLQLQRSHGNRFVQRLVDPDRSAPSTGIPAGIKSAVERRSGVDLSGVRVHYNSPRPARFGALASTQGEEIDVAPGQQAHLAHEAWHVVQQRQGRVPVTRTAAGIPLNDDAELEREAGQASRFAARAPARAPTEPARYRHTRPTSPAPVQLSAKHVEAQLIKYRKRKKRISDDALQKLLAIFATWEAQQKKADALSGKKGAGKLRAAARKKITKDVIEALSNNDEIPFSIRRKLIELWNRGSPASVRVDVKAPPKSAEPITLASGVPESWEPLSPSAFTYEYTPLGMSEDESGSESSSPEQGEPGRKEKKRKDPPEPEADMPRKQRRKSKKLVTGGGSKEEEELVLMVGTAREAAVLIRSFTKQERSIPKGFKIFWGQGMFEKGPYEDIVYTLTTEPETGVVAREGKVAKWTAILKEVPDEYWQDPARFFHLLQAALTGPPPSDPVLALVAGAMICDVKHGIGEWIQLLSELYPMLAKVKGTNSQKLFMEWYEYAASGGRDLSGRKLRTSYRQEPGRVETIEWNEPTLIPRRGGFQFQGAVPPGTHPFAWQIWDLVVKYGDDPAKLWALAMANRYFYNLVADWYRKTRQLEPKKQQ